MQTRNIVVVAFLAGAALGAGITLSATPFAAEDQRILAAEVDGLEEFVRDVIEGCVIVGAGTSMARITCHLEGY